MVKNIVNPIVELLLGILIVGIITTVPGVGMTGPGPINVESIVPEKSPWIGTPGWMKKETKTPVILV